MKSYGCSKPSWCLVPFLWVRLPIHTCHAHTPSLPYLVFIAAWTNIYGLTRPLVLVSAGPSYSVFRFHKTRAVVRQMNAWDRDPVGHVQCLLLSHPYSPFYSISLSLPRSVRVSDPDNELEMVRFTQKKNMKLVSLKERPRSGLRDRFQICRVPTHLPYLCSQLRHCVNPTFRPFYNMWLLTSRKASPQKVITHPREGRAV